MQSTKPASSLVLLLAADSYIDEVLQGFDIGKFFGAYTIPHTR